MGTFYMLKYARREVKNNGYISNKVEYNNLKGGIEKVYLFDVDKSQTREVLAQDLKEAMKKGFKVANLMLRSDELCCVGSRIDDYCDVANGDGNGNGWIALEISEDENWIKVIKCYSEDIIWIEKAKLLDMCRKRNIRAINFEPNWNAGEIKYRKEVKKVKSNRSIGNLDKYKLLGDFINISVFGDKVGLRLKYDNEKPLGSFKVPEDVNVLLSDCFKDMTIGNLDLGENLVEIADDAFNNVRIKNLRIKVKKGGGITCGKAFKGSVIENVLIETDNTWDYDIGFNLCGVKVLGNINIVGACNANVLGGVTVKNSEFMKYGFTEYGYKGNPIYIAGDGRVKFEIPEYVKSIGGHAFYFLRTDDHGYCYIEKLVLHENLEKVGNSSFNFADVGELVIRTDIRDRNVLSGMTVDMIALYANISKGNVFKDLEYLRKVDVYADEIGNNVLSFTKDIVKVIVDVKNKLRKIGSFAIEYATVTHIDLVGCDIGKDALHGCEIDKISIDMKNLGIAISGGGVKYLKVKSDGSKGCRYMVESVIRIDNMLIYGGEYVCGMSGNNVRLNDLTFADDIKIIGPYAFEGLKIRNLKLGKGIKRIESGAFINNRLSRVIVGKDVEVADDVFDKGVEVIRE